MKRRVQSKSVGPTIAVASGLGVLAILGVAIIFRKDIATACHLHWLENDGSYLFQVLEEPEGSAADMAVYRWAESPKGQEALFLILAEEAIGKWPAEIAPNLTQAVFILNEDKSSDSGFYLPGLGGFRAAANRNVARLRAVERYLPELIGRDFAWVHYPEDRFHIMDAVHAFGRLGIDSAAESLGQALEKGQPACLVERLPER